MQQWDDEGTLVNEDERSSSTTEEQSYWWVSDGPLRFRIARERADVAGS